jgi:hypothetical protein
MVVVFYDDGMAVSDCHIHLKDLSRQMLCDLLRAGLEPGVNKCIWQPRKIIEWNGLVFDFSQKTLSIMKHHIDKTLFSFQELIGKWPILTFRDVAKWVGRIVSMKPVFQLKTRMLHTVINIRS